MRLLILLFSTISAVNCAKILGFFYFPSISHQFVFRSIMKEMSLHGHDVTFITPNPLNDPSLVNLTEIDVSNAYELFRKYDFSNLGRSSLSLKAISDMMNSFSEEVIAVEMGHKSVQELLQKPSNTFDLIMIEPHSPFFFGFKKKFDAPVIAVSSLNVYSYYHHLIGNPTHPVLYPDVFSEKLGRQGSLIEKLDSIFVTLMWILLSELSMFPRSDLLADKYFGEGGPTIKEIIKDTSLWMLNVNPIFSDGKPNVPNVIEYFNIHLKRNESYPKDLQKILDNAKEGVVYFSLGTNVRFDHVQGDVKKTILEALGDLPYTVICKWESEKAEGQPKNVHLRKWLPQQAIIAHPHVKVFVTQGGLQSSEEAIINGVPLVVIPFLGDQPLNAQILTSKGMAETILPKHLHRKILTETIMKVANDEKYRNKAKELRDIFLDQPQSGIDKVIWWCEYVIRHKGAKHLRSPAADLPLYEYFMLDVLAVVLIAVYLVFKTSKMTIRLLMKVFQRTKSPTISKKKKN
ncbi:UDP-glycosyltransferase UGT5-like [Coccinella septempunctata]|uniref:UDP-glycosyltransferase UGT5-like n=1 Tax=Coccinella septempunctata TaxID=41139 RepID=UPI001D06FEA6|nr:UDP-glycosyltransferase UGT5-like [Coccinella septempunctata]